MPYCLREGIQFVARQACGLHTAIATIGITAALHQSVCGLGAD
jgi:hypothetical protein